MRQGLALDECSAQELTPAQCSASGTNFKIKISCDSLPTAKHIPFASSFLFFFDCQIFKNGFFGALYKVHFSIKFRKFLICIDYRFVMIFLPAKKPMSGL